MIGVATVLIGVILMLLWNTRSRDFFKGETFTPEWAEAHAPDLVEIV